MRFEKIWVEQCRATKAIKRRFGAKSALDYLVGEKLPMFAAAADDCRPLTPEELKAHIEGEIVKWKAVREKAGIEQEQ